MRRLGFVAFATCLTLTAQAAPVVSETAPAPRAIECASVFEIMSRAAPNWMSQPAVQAAQQAWVTEGLALADQSEVDYGTQLNREMVRLADISAQNPDSLSTLALNCLADAKL